MRISSVGIWRLLAIAAVAVLVQMHAGSTVVEGSYTGRDLALCVQGCNAIEDACKDGCRTDCGALYPVPSPQFDACNSACVNICSTEKQECKAKCNINKYPITPGEP